MYDPFEESLRDLLKVSVEHDDDAALGRVLKVVNRQVGIGDLFVLFGRGLKATMIALNNGSAHLAPVSRRTRSANKVE